MDLEKEEAQEGSPCTGHNVLCSPARFIEGSDLYRNHQCMHIYNDGQ